MLSALQRWLTREELEDTAGPSLFLQGKALLERGQVRRLTRGRDALDGEVGDARVFPAGLDAGVHGLTARCTCPGISQRGICKHAVALGLAWLEQSAPAQAPSTPAPRADPAGADRPSTPSAVQAWLAAHHLQHVTRLPVAALRPSLDEALARRLDMYAYAHPPLLAAVVGGEGNEFHHTLGAVSARTLHAAAWRFLDAERALVERGLEEEAARAAAPRPLPTDARLAPLVEALEAARARVRQHAPPRGAGAPRRTAHWSDTPPRISSREDTQVLVASAWRASGAVEVSLRPVELLSGREGLACTCMPGEPGRCVHALSALDDALAALREPAHAEVNARLADALLARGWTAVLDALEQAVARAGPRPGSTERPPEVSFRLCGDGAGAPQLRAFLHPPRKRGGHGRATPLGAHELPSVRDLLPPREREALEWLVSATPFEAERQRRALPHLLRLLAGSPRLFLEERPESPAQVRELPLGLVFVPGGDGAVLARPGLGGEPVDADVLLAAAALAPDGAPWLVVEPARGRVTLVDAAPGAVEVLESLRDYLPRFPADALSVLAGRLGGIERVFSVTLPAELEARLLPPEPTLVLRLVPTEETALQVTLLARPLAGAPPQLPGQGPTLLRAVRGTERVATERNLDAERAAAEALLARLGVPVPADGTFTSKDGAFTLKDGTFTLKDGRAALELLERLEPLRGPGLEVEWPGRAWRLLSLPPATQLKVEVEQRRDWFGLSGTLQVEGERLDLAVLLEALRRGERYVPLGTGAYVRLTGELQERLGALAEVAWEGSEGLTVGRAATPVLRALEAGGTRVRAAPAWRTLARALETADRRPAPVPEGLRAKLRDYQAEGFRWMAGLCAWGAGACLADEMGLGKTVQTLALLLHRAGEGPALVVAPTSVCPSWVREAARFAPGLQVTPFHGADREAALAALGPGHVLVVSFGLLARDVERFAPVRFATLVVDEAQAVKNPDTVRARALRRLQADARVALSGTPVENRLEELWSLFALLSPGLLGTREAFRARFISPPEQPGAGELPGDRRAALARVVRPFLLRRTKAQVARELPSRTEVTVPVPLSPGERRLYEDARLAAVARFGTRGSEEQRFEVLAALTRLRLLACHPRLGDTSTHLPSSKTARLLELVAELRAGGGRALVFSQFVSHLALVREALEARGVPLLQLDGSTPPAERARRVEAFQRGEGDVFLISLKAGGTGLNLTAADHVIHLDPWWNPAVEDQATDRAHRIGQTKPVTVLRLVAEGTLEEAILTLHQEKRELAASFLSDADGARALTTDQLLALLRYASDEASPPEPLPGREAEA